MAEFILKNKVKALIGQNKQVLRKEHDKLLWQTDRPTRTDTPGHMKVSLLITIKSNTYLKIINHPSPPPTHTIKPLHTPLELYKQINQPDNGLRIKLSLDNQCLERRASSQAY